MSNFRAAVQSLLATSSALWLSIASFFASLWMTLILTFKRKHRVELVTNEEKSAPVSGDGAMSIIQMIKDKCPSLYGPDAYFKPTWWMPGGNFQTVWCVIAEMIHRDSIPYTRQLLRVPDGGTISLDAYPPFESEEDDTPILFILHGLTGSTQESYIRDTVKEVTRSKVFAGEKGFRVVAMNFRGCDVDTPVTSQRLYHAGETDDTRCALLWLTQTYPNAPIYGAAYSMGASTIATYLGQEGEKTPMKGVISVSNPWDWVIATHHIENGNWLNRYIYGPVLADALLTMFKNSRYAFVTDKRINIKDIYSKRYVSIRFFDERVTAPLFGFKDAWDYYQHASSEPLLDKIRVPHLSLHTVDDPMVAPWNLPYARARKSSHVVMATTHAGGHVAWFTTKDNQLRRWFSTPIREFIEAIQSIDPLPRLAPSVLPPDAKGMVRSAEYPDRVGFLPIDGEGLTTARVFNTIANNQNLGS